MDAAARWTDAQLKALERRINAEYTKAYKEMKKEMSELAAKLADPTLSPHKRMLLATQNQRLQNLIDQMADTLRDTNASTARFVTQSAQNIFKHNYNTEAERLGFDILDDTAVKNILTGEVNPFTKLAIAADKEKAPIVRKLESELTTAILKGESIPDIARRLKSVSEGYLGNTIRIARTETTRVQNSARQSVGEHGKELGFEMYKEWVSTNDARTREEHRAANGQQVPIDEPFKVGGEELMYAGDISLGASPWNTINCRCTVINIIKKKNADAVYSDERKEEAKTFNKENYDGEQGAKQAVEDLQFEQTSDVWFDLTEEQQKIAYSYTADSDTFNYPLRTSESVEEIPDHYRHDIEELTDIIDKSELQDDVWLERGQPITSASKFLGISEEELSNASEERLSELLVGEIRREKGFMSTTGYTHYESDFGNVIYEIFTPKGSKGLYMEPFSYYGGNDGLLWDGLKPTKNFGKEVEILLQRGGKYRITGIERRDGKLFVSMELVGVKK